MRIAESRLRRIIRRAILERMGTSAGVSYDGTPEMQLLQDAFGDPAMAPEDVRFLAFSRHLGYPESITVRDAVIHAGHEPVVIDGPMARAAGTDIASVSDMLRALGALHTG